MQQKLFVCTVTDFSAAEKARGVLVYYPDRSSPLLEVTCQRSRSPGTKTRLALRSPTWLAYEWYALVASGCCCSAGGRAHFLAGEGWHRRRRGPRLVGRLGITHDARWAFRTGGGGVD